jgi:hypothetical protein
MHSVHSETDSIENEINSKLKILLKEKIQKIEKIGNFILKFLPDDHPHHAEGLSDRIRLVEEGYHEMEGEVGRVEEGVYKTREEIGEKEKNLNLLKIRTKKSEFNYNKTNLLFSQKTRLESLLTENTCLILSLRDRVELLETHAESGPISVEIPEIGVLESDNKFILDRIIGKILPCI